MSRRRVLVLLCLAACGPDEARPDAADTACRFRTAADDIAPPPIYTPPWAFRPWISKDISDAADTRAFIQGFAERDIPVGVLVIDSPWETHYNTFEVNPSRYPDFPQLVDELHAQDVRVVLWITQMVNESAFDFELGGDSYVGPSPNFAAGRECGFFVDEGATYLWWKGFGAGVDFLDPEAVGWWHRQQDTLYAAGIDGWKLDFGEEYIPGPLVATAAGPVERQAYSEAYYADFYAYGASRRGTADFVTMVRPYDRSYGFPGRFYARPEHAPVAWVGDNRRDWLGLADALDHLFRSAAAGYVVIGSDIGGYLDRDDEDIAGMEIPFDTLVFARWTALGALTPFMQLHGRANITPWTVPDNVDATVALYRYWATLHDELVPFFYSLAEAAYAGAAPPMRPLGAEASWAGDYRYLLGEAFLVAPILDPSGVRDVALPAGRWYDWWAPGDAAIAGDTTITAYDATARDRIPLFVHEGAIVPARIANAVTGLGTAARRGAATLLVWPAPEATSFAVYAADRSVAQTITARRDATSIEVALSAVTEPTYLRIRADAAPATVTVDGAALTRVTTDAALDAAASGWRYDTTGRWLWIKLAAQAGAATVIAAD